MVHVIMKNMVENAVPAKDLVESIKETAIGTIIAKEDLFVDIIVVLDLFQAMQTAVVDPESPIPLIPDFPYPQIPDFSLVDFCPCFSPNLVWEHSHMTSDFWVGR